MLSKRKCKKCNEDMRHIGPFIRVVGKKEIIKKGETVFRYQCLNSNCKNFLELTTYNIVSYKK